MINVEKLALLARIKLTPTEKEKLQKEFEDILNYVSQLKKVDVRGVEEDEKINNVMREDEKQNEPGDFSEKLLKSAPFVEKGYVKVKHILE